MKKIKLEKSISLKEIEIALKEIIQRCNEASKLARKAETEKLFKHDLSDLQAGYYAFAVGFSKGACSRLLEKIKK